MRYLRRRLGDDAAEDASIEVFGRAVDTWAGGTERFGAPRPWLYALATEAISARWRIDRGRLERLERLADQAPVRHPALAPPRPLDPRIVAGLRSLSALDRETVLLLCWGELSRGDVAATLGIPLGSVSARLDRVCSQAPHGRSDPPGGAGFDEGPGTRLELDELLAILGDNADLGLQPVRQPRIESAVNQRFAVAPSRLRPRRQSGGPQAIGA
ncbi:MAG: hypothetical protein ITG02_04705 [Patulibacter sp.]|nr:hypothetical protein [Patulibacter sp.]